jgi:hypothetical protein
MLESAELALKVGTFFSESRRVVDLKQIHPRAERNGRKDPS